MILVMAMVLVAGVWGGAAAASGPVAWWQAEGNANDSAGANHGTYIGTVTYVPGVMGQAFSFNGSAVRVPNYSSLNFGTGPFSGALWVKTIDGSGFLVDKDIPGRGRRDWFVYLTGGRARFVVGRGDYWRDYGVTSAVPINDGEFHHVAWVREGTTLRIYIDGALSSTAWAPRTNVNNGVEFAIGAEITYGTRLINTLIGVIDEVRLYNRVLSAEEIQAFLNQPPDVSGATPSIAEIWPPNNKMVDITIEGVIDPDGDDVTITIDDLTNDETGAADAAGIGTSTAQVRASRDGKGDGRDYTIAFTASDGTATSSGTVTVTVPHDQGKGKAKGRGKPIVPGAQVSTWGQIKKEK